MLLMISTAIQPAAEHCAKQAVSCSLRHPECDGLLMQCNVCHAVLEDTYRLSSSGMSLC